MSLTLEIVTPVGVVYRKGELDAVTLPASDGEIQILPGHIPLITILDAGGSACDKRRKRRSIAVDTGYARCIADTVSVLTESAIDVQRSTKMKAEGAPKRLRRRWRRQRTRMSIPTR